MLIEKRFLKIVFCTFSILVVMTVLWAGKAEPSVHTRTYKCRLYQKSWPYLFYVKAEVQAQKQIPSWVSGDASSLFHEISRIIDSFVRAAWTSICRCSRGLLQPFATMCAWFVELPHHFHSVGPSCDVLRAQGIQVWATGRMGGALPNKIFQFFPMSDVRACIIVFRNVSFRWVLIMKCKSQFL
jgi:hypothetical protein